MPKKFASMNDEETENAFSTSPQMRHIYELFVEAQDGATHSKKRAAIRALMEAVFTIEEHRLMLAQQVDAEKKRYIDLLAKLDRTEQELMKQDAEPMSAAKAKLIEKAAKPVPQLYDNWVVAPDPRPGFFERLGAWFTRKDKN